MLKTASTLSDIRRRIVALNHPVGWDIFEGDFELSLGQIKFASIDKGEDEDLGGFDLKAAIEKNPDHLFVKVLAIKKDEVNDNGDAFNEEELRKAANTFIGVPVFCNHANDDIEKARGMVVHAWYDDSKGGIWTINRVDKVAYPKLARGIEAGYVSGTSMGASLGSAVTYSKNGLVRVSDLKVGDELLTHSNKYRTVKRIEISNDNDELYNIKWVGNSDGLKLTCEHPILILPSEKVYRWSNEKKYRLLPEEINQLVEPEWKKASEVKQDDYVLEYVPREIEDDENISVSMAYLLGTYAAEGFVGDNGKSVTFCFGIGDQQIELTKKRLQECGVNSINDHIRADRNGHYLYVWDKSFANICNDLVGSGAHEKRISNKLLKLPNEKQLAFVGAFIDGDGCIVKERIDKFGRSTGPGSLQLSSCNRKLLDGIRKICMRLNVFGSVHSVERQNRSSTVVDQLLITNESNLRLNNNAKSVFASYSFKAALSSDAKMARIDSLKYRDFIAHRVNSVEIVENEEPTYYVEVDGPEHSYMLDEIVTHNCQVQYSICSICHNRSFTSEEYCTHVKNSKTRKFNGSVKCAFHSSKQKPQEKECPLCGCESDSPKKHEYKEALVHEWNYGLKFIEDSFVVNPACHDCLVECVLNVPELNKKSSEIIGKARKIASAINGGLVKVASATPPNNVVEHINHIITKANKIGNSEYTAKLIKVAGKIEIQNLNQAMKLMEVVAKSMMDQKEQVSMEYVSDIVDVLASLQTVTDELIEMGYANIQSPQTLQDPNSLSDAAPVPNAPGNNQVQPGVMPNPSVQPQAAPQGDIGSVTKPTLSSSNQKIKDSENTSVYTQQANDVLETIKKLFKNDSDADITASANTSNLKESKNMATNTDKVAANQAQKPEFSHKTTEKQLQEAKVEFHPRTDESPVGITESDKQLGGKEQYKDVSSESGQVRKDEPADVVTEGQFKTYTGTPIARWNEFADTILEKNWTEFSRAVGSELSQDQSDHPTEGQIKDLLSHHRWVEPTVTTEGQLGSSENWLTTDNAWLSKSAEVRTAYSKAVVTAALSTLSDAIANYNITPTELVKVANFISKDPQSQIKAAFIVLVNGVPGKKALRQAEIDRARYFGKSSSIQPVDAVLACAGDNCLNIKAEDLIDAIIHLSVDTKKLAKVEETAKAKLASLSEAFVDDVEDKFAAFDKAFEVIAGKKEDEEDEEEKKKDCEVCGKAKCCCAGTHVYPIDMLEIGVDPSDKDAFVLATEKIAKSMHEGEDAVLTNVDIDEDLGYVEATLKEVNKLTAEEKESLQKTAAYRRSSLVKDAQGMGGELGGGMGGGAGGPGGGGAPGGGATMPTPPGAEAAPGMPPAETFSDPGEDADGTDGDAEAKPPGSICPVCGTQDVDIVGGKGRCNNEKCGAEFVYKVNVDVTKWPGLVGDSEDAEGEDMPPLNEEVGDASEDGNGSAGGEGFEMPGGGAGADASIPVAAMTRITPKMLKKLSAGNPNYKLGSVSPLTGTTNTFEIGNGDWLCLDTGRTYNVDLAVDNKNVHNVFAEWRWTPKLPIDDCSSCRRAKQAWVGALKFAGMTDTEFEALSFKKRAEVVLDMHEKGLFKTVKTASRNASVLNEIKQAYTTTKFPLDECRAKIAKRFGENAIALSGPNKGSNLADCVCNQLKNASAYSDGLAIKVADSWSDKDGCIQCIEDYVRIGFDMDKAATACQYLKLKYASNFELFAEDLSDSVPFGDEQETEQHHHEEGNDEFASDLNDDPFSDEQNGEGGDEVHGDEPELPGVSEGPDGVPGEAEIEIDLGPEGIGEVSEPGLGGEEIALPGVGGEEGSPTGDDHGTVTIKLPLHALDALEEAIDLAHGEDPSEEGHHDIPPGDANKEVEVELPEEAADGFEDAAEPVLDEETGEESSEEPSDELPEDSDESEGGDDLGFGGEEDGPEISPESEFKEGDEMGDKDRLASYMRRGKISGYGEINLDVNAIAKAIGLKTGGKPKLERAQDAVEDYSNGSTIGSEEKFDAKKPKVPEGGSKAKIGEDENEPGGELPDVPTGSAEMGEEKELGYTSDGASYTGGAKGQGKTETAKNKRTSVNDGKQVTVPTKKADKLEKAKPVSDLETELKVPRSHKDHRDTPDSVKRETLSEKEYPKIPEKGEGARIKGEVDMGSVPKSDKDEYTPDIPVRGPALKGEEFSKSKNAPEMELAHKGTIIARSDEKSKKEIEAEAVRLAGRMVEERIISPSHLLEKIAELKQYQMPTLKQIEKTLFANRTKKGLAIGPDGVEQTVIISESSNERAPNHDAEFQQKLQSMFKLHRQNELASASEKLDAELRRAHNR